MVREKVRLRKSLPLALDWLVDIAMMKTESLSSEQNSHKLEHKYWKGAIKGEYSVVTKTWDFFFHPFGIQSRQLKHLLWH